MVAAFTPEAVIINPLGQPARGRAEIERVLGVFLEGPAAYEHSVAGGVRDAGTSPSSMGKPLERAAGPEGALTPLLVHRFTDVAVKQDGTWLLAHVRAYVLMLDPSTP